MHQYTESVNEATTKRGQKPGAPSLEWCVVGTLAWFGLLGRPLRLEELERLLLKQRASREEIYQSLATLEPLIKEHNGYYHLVATKVHYPDEESERWYQYKWWRVRLAVAAIRWIPYVRLVAVANTLANRTAGKDSDIDVFIIVQHGHLYLTRTLVTLMLQLTGLRRHSKKVANRICLSFFVTTDHLDLSTIAFRPYDIYLAYWISELIPVLDAAGTHQRLLKANQWISQYIPHSANRGAGTRPPSRVAQLLEKVFGGIAGTLIEERLASWQRRRIARRPKSRDQDVQIVATDSMLKFHEKERRKVYRDEWEALMRKLGYDPELILS